MAGEESTWPLGWMRERTRGGNKCANVVIQKVATSAGLRRHPRWPPNRVTVLWSFRNPFTPSRAFPGVTQRSRGVTQRVPDYGFRIPELLRELLGTRFSSWLSDRQAKRPHPHPHPPLLPFSLSLSSPHSRFRLRSDSKISLRKEQEDRNHYPPSHISPLPSPSTDTCLIGSVPHVQSQDIACPCHSPRG